MKSGDLKKHVAKLKRQHPSLEDRLDRYRARRVAYDRKRDEAGMPASDLGGTPQPAQRRARRELV